MHKSNISRFHGAAAGLLLSALSLTQTGCGTLDATQRGALLVGAETLANIAGTAAATYYGGAEAGQLASAGLSAVGSVLQGYVGTTIPTAVVQATPGVANVGQAVAAVIAPNHTVSQGDVTAVYKAATIAANLPAAAAATGAAPAGN